MSICESKTYEAIFNRYSESIRNFVYYKCGDMEKAEDITQEAFIKLWKQCASIIVEKAKSFLYTVANNLFINDYKHGKVVLQHRSSIKESVEAKTPEYLMEEEEFMLKLKEAISNLKSNQREVFLLSRIDGKTYKEIAEIIGISEKAVEKRMHKALLNLRAKIKFHI
ncbi:RNA polymerase sigma factor [Marinifilum caeruleilacunae]|uniref:RNA polymerase sigma factor n=1 Tax=Marinifilum caeruleilacunae TaxID=2499076 RepID=A0ABX1X1X9_9BACT|nr:RNA polymerase sigma factor [Marinifilum caeruleilacunae]NOU62093.1 RNA polymerase sigma factor [Marinifilum caeruleilacunae]